jgi:hypothetical protein
MSTFRGDDNPIIVLKIPGLCMVNELLLATLKQVILDFSERVHKWKNSTGGIKDRSLFKIGITCRKDICPTGSTELVPQDERTLASFDSDMTNKR